MKNKSPKPARKSILHYGELVPITDPAEIAALERRIRAAEKMLARGGSVASKPKARKGK